MDPIRVALAVACLWAGTVGAQIPGLPSLGTASKPSVATLPAPAGKVPAAPEARDALVERLKKQLADANAERTREVDPPPPGISPAEVSDLRDARNLLATVTEVQLRSLEELDKARAAREAAETAARNWRGFDDKPPYSILMVDELRDAADALRVRIDAMERSQAHLRTELDRYVAEARRGEESLRRAQEAMEQATDADDRLRATWRRDLAQLRLRVLAGRGATTQLLQQVQAEEIATRMADLGLLERKVAIAAKGATFGEADLAKARERLATLVKGYRAEQMQLAERLPARVKERDEAQRALAQLRERSPGATDDLKAAASRARAGEAWVDALRSERDLLEALATLAEETARIWEARRAAFLAEDADERLAAAERIRAAGSRLARWQGYLDNVAGLQRARLAEAESFVVRGDATAGEIRWEQDNAAALRRLLTQFERAQDTLRATSRTLDRWAADIEKDRGERSLAARLADHWSALKGGVREVWNFELFAVEDTTVVDGREVRTSRGVTVGKSIGAVLVFVLGYWLAFALARRLERGFVARGFDPGRVRNYRRWTLFGVAAALALFTLNVARIPLTVFAFLGGALAIGVGFGTQTIIRNFVSGLILLAERRIQIGDIVEVDGITGTVTSVDLRSSTVLGFDGVETSVPNSVLIENKVTNWTQTDRRVRRVVRVGVAYGSPLREVAGILEECAKRHGVVLDTPAPLVLFEDFGADALAFALHYWVELRPGVHAGQVASDLRFMIAKRFEEAGIVVAFPQRDVHLDASRPLRVEVVGRAADAAPAAG